MLDAFIDGLFLVLQWKAFSLMLVGMALGFCVGLLPGIGGAATLALMIPFVFKMAPAEAFAFLLGMHSVAATTGDITSILFGVPGEGLSAATVVDGYPMAKNGEAGRALGAALMSSLVGALIGAVALALAIPIVRPLVLTFGSPELFLLSMIGIACITSLSGSERARSDPRLRHGLARPVAFDHRPGAPVGLAPIRHGAFVPVGRARSRARVGGHLRDSGVGRSRGARHIHRRRPSRGKFEPRCGRRHQRYLPPLLAGISLLGGRRIRRHHARRRRRRRPMDGLRPCRAERERRQGPRALRQGRCARRARARRGEQFQRRRRSRADHRFRRAGQRRHGDSARRIHDHGIGARPRHAEQASGGDLLDGLDSGHRQHHHRRVVARRARPTRQGDIYPGRI